MTARDIVIAGTDLCTGRSATAEIVLRLRTGLDPGRDRTGQKERKGLELIKKMGAQVDVKTFGPVVCSTIIPTGEMAKVGYNTTCTVSKDTAVAGIEVQVAKQTDMIPIERLRPLAEKMAARF